MLLLYFIYNVVVNSNDLKHLIRTKGKNAIRKLLVCLKRPKDQSRQRSLQYLCNLHNASHRCIKGKVLLMCAEFIVVNLFCMRPSWKMDIL